jgi:membrane protein implicated in regulation of membrane protease activity
MLDWTAPTLWWLAAGALVAAELLTGTFYLLMLALGAAAGALAAHSGLGATAQVACAAVAGGGAVVVWHLVRSRQLRSARPEADASLNLDIGCPVQVAHWRADGTARVHHRGAEWEARFAGPGQALPGPHVIRAVHANQLQLARAASS